ncbi:MAG TPA: SAM-dependent methyltransferase [Candidatus Acidoferrum sp.]
MNVRFLFSVDGIGMNGKRASRTAEYMAFFRAMESARPEGRWLFVDPFAERFVGAGLRRAVSASRWGGFTALVNRYADWRLPGARTSAIARTKLIDDALVETLREEVSQVVILGAGFDCRAYRLPAMEGAKVFEVDHPSTLARKLEVLLEILPEIPETVRSVEIDFNREMLPEVLARAGFQLSRPTVFLWEGVTNYLTAEAVDSVLRFVATCRAGSRIIFTYVHDGLLDGSVQFDGGERILQDVRRLGEPWTFGIVPAKLGEFLGRHGLGLDGDLSAREYRRKYFGESARKMTGYEFYHVAFAHVLHRGGS